MQNSPEMPPRLPRGLCVAALIAFACTSSGCGESPEAHLISRASSKRDSRASISAEVQDPHAASAEITAEEQALKSKIVQACLSDLEALARNPLLVSAVLEANRSNVQTPAQILEQDVKWRQATSAADPLIAQFLNNPCAEELRKVQAAHPDYAELFLMDDKGCIVGESNKTSDYWQGDEAKWIESFHAGKGQVFVDGIEYDQSTQRYVIQISLPVFDTEQNTVGALTVSVLARNGA